MKTKFGFSKLLGFVQLVVLLSAFGCSQGGGGGGGTTASTPQYTMNNGSCYSNGQPVSMNYCQNNGGYRMNGNSCINSNGQVVDYSFCQNNGGGGYYPGGYPGGGYGNGMCYGYYYVQTGYWTQMVQCYGMNCSGFTLTSISGQSQLCR